MTAQRGRDLLLRLGDGGQPETFTAVAGLRSTLLAFAAETLDATTPASPGAWRALLDRAGTLSARISGSGLFKDAAADGMIRATFFAQRLADWQVAIPDFGIVSGPFKLTQLQYEGPYDGEVTIALTLVSAGTLSFTAL